MDLLTPPHGMKTRKITKYRKFTNRSNQKPYK
jgi:hypothetical protein